MPPYTGLAEDVGAFQMSERIGVVVSEHKLSGQRNLLLE